MKTRRIRKAIDQVKVPAESDSGEKESLSDIKADLRDMMRSISIVPDKPEMESENRKMESRRAYLRR